MKTFGFGLNLGQFQAGQNALKLRVLDALSRSDAGTGATLTDLEQKVTDEIVKHDKVKADFSLDAVLPSVLAEATHEGLVEVDQSSEHARWKLSGKGQKRLDKSKGDLGTLF
jgi:hypothetical protein